MKYEYHVTVRVFEVLKKMNLNEYMYVLTHNNNIKESCTST